MNTIGKAEFALLAGILLLIGALMAVMGCACPLVDMRRTYIVPMYGAGDNMVTVPVDVEHRNNIEAKVADRLTGVQGAEISGKDAVKASVK